MNRRRDLARGARHTSIGDQRNLEPAILKDTQKRRHLVQLGHAIAARPLEAHHGDEIALQLARLEGIGQLFLILEHLGRRFDDLMFRSHGGHFHHATAQVAFHDPQTTFRRERTGNRAQDIFIEAFERPFTPDQFAVFQERLLGVAAQAITGHGVDVFVQQTGSQQLANQERHAACRLEVVDIGFAVGVDVTEGRYHFRQIGHVLPGQLNARGLGNGRHVQGVVGRAARRVQRNDGIDQRALVDDLADRHEAAALHGQTRHLASRFDGQCITQGCVGIDERSTRKVHTHHFHHQLVGVGGAVEGAGSRTVIRLHFRVEQLFTGGLAFRIPLPYVGFFLVGDA